MENELTPDALLTPLLYAFNTLDQNVQVIIGDKPMLIQREYIGRGLKLKQVQDLFEITTQQWDKSNFGFNPMLYYKDVTALPRTTYITEVLR